MHVITQGPSCSFVGHLQIFLLALSYSLSPVGPSEFINVPSIAPSSFWCSSPDISSLSPHHPASSHLSEPLSWKPSLPTSYCNQCPFPAALPAIDPIPKFRRPVRVFLCLIWCIPVPTGKSPKVTTVLSSNLLELSLQHGLPSDEVGIISMTFFIPSGVL